MVYRIREEKSIFRKTYFSCDLSLSPEFEGSIYLSRKFHSIDEALNWVESMRSKYVPKRREVIYGIGELK